MRLIWVMRRNVEGMVVVGRYVKVSLVDVMLVVWVFFFEGGK